MCACVCVCVCVCVVCGCVHVCVCVCVFVCDVIRTLIVLLYSSSWYLYSPNVFIPVLHTQYR